MASHSLSTLRQGLQFCQDFRILADLALLWSGVKFLCILLFRFLQLCLYLTRQEQRLFCFLFAAPKNLTDTNRENTLSMHHQGLIPGAMP